MDFSHTHSAADCRTNQNKNIEPARYALHAVLMSNAIIEQSINIFEFNSIFYTQKKKNNGQLQ